MAILLTTVIVRGRRRRMAEGGRRGRLQAEARADRPDRRPGRAQEVAVRLDRHRARVLEEDVHRGRRRGKEEVVRRVKARAAVLPDRRRVPAEGVGVLPDRRQVRVGEAGRKAEVGAITAAEKGMVARPNSTRLAASCGIRTIASASRTGLRFRCAKFA
jgi:hypothetical protein